MNNSSGLNNASMHFNRLVTSDCDLFSLSGMPKLQKNLCM